MKGSTNHVGRCIYCDSTKNLTREHVIPEGIGGRIAPTGRHEALVLRAATCDECKNVTHAFEGEVQGKMMGYFRAAKGLVHKDRATAKRKIKVQRADGTEEFVEVEIGALPAVVMLPVFGQPGIISGTPIGGPYDMQIAAFADYDPDKLHMEKGAKFSLGGLAPDTFCQMLAKIGLGTAVHQFGIDGFKPLVREFILGKKNEFGHWVGGPLGKPPEPPSPDMLHDIHLRGHDLSGTRYIVAWIRLFANLGGPRNCVIVGEMP